MNLKYLFASLLLLLSAAIYAQNAPPGINYQAVARNDKGQVLTNKNISLQIRLYAGEIGGKAAYTEVHNITTNELGLFSLVVGKGEMLGGDFQQVPWSSMNVWMELAMDETGGRDFHSINASQLMAVPYAFHAATAGDLASGHNDDGSEKTAAFWKVNGNELTFPGPHFIGTLDYKDFVMKTNNQERLRITADGDINISKSLSIGLDLTVGRDVSVGRDLDVDNNANIDNNLTVGGIARFNNTAQSNTKDDGSVIVEGGVGIEKNINVGGNSAVTGNSSVGGNSSVTGNSTVGGNSAVTGNSTVGGTLGVNGIARFNNTAQSTSKDDGAVIVEGGVGIEKNINVGGSSSVAGNSTIGGNNTVIGNTTTGSLNVNTSANIKTKLTVDGNNAIDGGDGSSAAYPLVVQGSNQGIWVGINTGRDNSTNFITFSDGSIRGRVEGQTLTELHNSFEYIWFQAMEAAGTALGIAMVAVDLVGVDDFDAAVVNGVELIAHVAEWVKAAVELENNIGVAFESGSGDYAEWLLKANPAEKFSYGDIVGVRGGMISKDLSNADHFMVISQYPIVLGNMPEGGNTELYEKVAFLGQVPIKIKGTANIGDYIVASTQNDGFGTAVNPKDITLDQISRIVGVAWSEVKNNAVFSYVNGAIGINVNDVVSKMKQHEAEMAAIGDKVNGIIAYLKSKDPSFDATELEIDLGVLATNEDAKPEEDEDVRAGKPSTGMSLIQLLEQNSDLVASIQAKTKQLLDEKGINYQLFDQTNRLVTDKQYFVETLREYQNTISE